MNTELSKFEKIMINIGKVTMWMLIALETLQILLTEHIPGWMSLVIAAVAVVIYIDVRWMYGIFATQPAAMVVDSVNSMPKYKADIEDAIQEATSGKTLGDLF